MMAAGDEMGRTQQGNNNAYCQDNDLSWVDWEGGAKQADLLEFACGLSALRRRHPVFRRRRFFSGLSATEPGPGTGGGMQDLVWLTPSGHEMTGGDWDTYYARSLGVFLNGSAISEPGPYGETVRDDDFLLFVNAHSEPVTFVLPGARFAAEWEIPGTRPLRRTARLPAPAGPGRSRPSRASGPATGSAPAAGSGRGGGRCWCSAVTGPRAQCPAPNVALMITSANLDVSTVHPRASQRARGAGLLD